MHLSISSTVAILQVVLAAANALPRGDDDATSVNLPTSDASNTSTTTLETLPLCCCCLATPPYTFDEPQPSLAHYMGECSKAGVRDVCGDEYTGISGYALGGLEGQPDEIAARCAVTRCGAMLFVD
jgi:hypothetical protein